MAFDAGKLINGLLGKFTQVNGVSSENNTKEAEKNMPQNQQLEKFYDSPDEEVQIDKNKMFDSVKKYGIPEQYEGGQYNDEVFDNEHVVRVRAMYAVPDYYYKPTVEPEPQPEPTKEPIPVKYGIPTQEPVVPTPTKTPSPKPPSGGWGNIGNNPWRLNFTNIFNKVFNNTTTTFYNRMEGFLKDIFSRFRL